MAFSILVISPSYSIREMLARYLTSDDFIVYTADSAAMAVPMLASMTLNAVITELNIEQASGLDLLLWMNHKLPQIHPLFICDTDDTDLMQVLRQQRASVLQKNRLNLLQLRNMLYTMREYERAVTFQFQQINLYELVHVAAHSGQSRHIYFSNPQTSQEGLVHFANGRVQHAMYDNQAGHDAFYEIVQLKKGLFQESAAGKTPVYSEAAALDQRIVVSALSMDQRGSIKMPTTYCTVLSADMALCDYFSQHYPEAELEMLCTDLVAEALIQVESKADLLIVDLDLPDFDFDSFLRSLGRKKISTRIILMGSRSQDILTYYLDHPHVYRFFLKPEQFQELGDLVNHTYLSQQFSGNLLNVPLFNVLQTFTYYRQSRVFEVTDFFSGQTGQIFLSEGEIQHATFDAATGRDALKEMLKIRYGLFRQETYWEPAERSLRVPFSQLLLYLSRFLEQTDTAPELPRNILLQNGSMVSLQLEKISYLLAMAQEKMLDNLEL